MKKKFIFWNLSLITFLSMNLIFLTACSATWTKWEKKYNEKEKIIEYKNKIKPAEAKKYLIRNNIFKIAYNKTQNIINLNKINNQFEFIEVINELIKFQPTNLNIDEFWNNFDALNEYINKIKPQVQFKFKYDNLISKNFIKWNIIKIIDNIKKSIKEFKKIENTNNNKNNYEKLIKDLQKAKNNKNKQKSEKQILKIREQLKVNPISMKKFFDIKIDGLKNGQPIDFGNVAKSAIQLISNDAVAGLLDEDLQLALNLSKLVNLPKLAFKGFQNLIIEIDNLFNNIFVWTQNNINKKSVFYNWYKNINFQTMANGFINLEQKTSELNNLKKIKGLFLANKLKLK